MREAVCRAVRMSVSRNVSMLAALTVFTENTAITLSHSEPLFGWNPSSLDSPRANQSTRSLTSKLVYVLPVRPQVNGLCEYPSGCLPNLSSSIKSQIGTESGGSNGSSGTHDGGTKGILAAPERTMHQLMRDPTHDARVLTECTKTTIRKQNEFEAL
jgi:hypothetical protein